jgi:uncharacterized phiE125 gp8 family phage protein
VLVLAALTVKTPPASEPVSIDVLRAHLRQDQDFEDGLLAIYLATARQMAESYLGRALLTQTLVSTLRDLRPDRSGGSFGSLMGDPNAWGLGRNTQEIELPRSPLVSVTSVKLIDTGSPAAAITLDPTTKAEYVIDATTEPGRVRIDWGAVQTSETLSYPIQHMQIEFVAGYATADLIPAPIVHAVMTHATFLYENRGDAVAEMPADIEALLWPYRILFIGG